MANSKDSSNRISSFPRSRLIVIGITVSYILTYVTFSFCGEYSHPLSTGKYRHFGSLSIPDLCIWQPMGMIVRPKMSNDNTLAIVFLPLLSLDRWLWHSDVITFHGGE